MNMYNLRRGIYLIIFSMPLYLWRFSVLGIPVNFLEMMIYTTFLFWILVLIKKENFNLFISESIREVKWVYKNNFVLSIGIILLFSGLIISISFSSDIKASLGIFKGWFIDPFLFFIVFVNVIKTREHIVCFLQSWIFSGFVVSLISIFYLLFGIMTFDGRLKAFFLSPNHLAMYLAPAFLIIFWFILTETKFLMESIVSGVDTIIWRKRIKMIILLIIAILLYFTHSYGAFLGIFVGVLYLIIKKNQFRMEKNRFFAIIILLFSGFIFLSASKFNQIINSENRSSFHSRLMIWNTTREIIKDNPFLGIGPGTFQEIYLSYADKFQEPYLEWAVPQPHNIFLAFYLQTGLIGFLGFILILIWFFFCGNITKSRAHHKTELTYLVSALMIYILVHGLVDTTYWKNDLAIMFWIIIGLKLINMNNLQKVKEKKKL